MPNSSSLSIAAGVSDVSPQIAVVQFPRRLFMADAPTVRRQIIDLVAQGRHQLVLDLSAVQALDSSGLSVLVTAQKQVEQSAGSAVLVRPKANVMALLEMMRLQEVFAIFDDCRTAVSALH